jgi:tripartite-type tricarboxylate transporter receptor subunit TctC
MNVRRGMSAASAFAAAVLVLPSALQAQDFYHNRQINFIVASGAGGGYDTNARVLARTLPNHIPGQPKIIVQNMPGASGIQATNHLYTIADRDGTVIGATANTMPLDPLLGGPASRFDPRQLGWVGSIGKQINVCLAWHASSIKSFEQVQQQEVKVSATGATGWRAIMPRILNSVAGTKYKVITGYATTESMLAVERGEVDGICTTFETLMASQQQWLTDKKVTFLAQFGFEPIPALKDVPMGLNFVKDPADLEAIRLIFLQQETGRPIVAPPGVPSGRLAILRKAFDDTMKDPAFLADAAKAQLDVSSLSGEAIDEMLKKAYSAPEATVERAKVILARATEKKE